MRDIEDIYVAFRRAQSKAKNRPWQMPKNFEAHLEKRMAKKSVEALELSVKYFNTKWSNIDPEKYFDCGFELFKSFSYNQFFDPRIIKLYIEKDKNVKREIGDVKDRMKKSSKFVKRFIDRTPRIRGLKAYGNTRKDGVNLAVKHYLDNRIDKFFLAHLINKGIVNLNDDDRALIPHVTDSFRDLLEMINKALKGEK